MVFRRVKRRRLRSVHPSPEAFYSPLEVLLLPGPYRVVDVVLPVKVFSRLELLHLELARNGHRDV